MTEREYNRIKARLYQEKNPERCRERNRLYYAANAERINAARRAKRAERRNV